MAGFEAITEALLVSSRVATVGRTSITRRGSFASFADSFGLFSGLNATATNQIEFLSHSD